MAALAPAAELLPAVGLEAGQGVWLTPVAAGLILVPLLWLAGAGEMGRLPALLCGIWMEVLLILRLTLCARRCSARGSGTGRCGFSS